MVTVLQQLRSFLISVSTGVLVGVLYDGFWLLRHRMRLRQLGTGVGDLFFWMVTTGLAFFLLLLANNGEVRLYVLLGMVAGLVVYFSYFSPYLRKIITGIVNILVKVLFSTLGVILWPISLIKRVILVPIGVVGMAISRLKRLIPRRLPPPE